MRRYAGIVFFLLALLALTWAARTLHLRHVERNAAEIALAQTESASDVVEARFNSLQREMQSLAQRVGSAGEIRSALRYLAEREGTTAADPAVQPALRVVQALDLDPLTSVELYDATTRLVAWKGFGFPLDASIYSPSFPDSLLSGIVSDGGVRDAVVLWQPVRLEGRTLGTVRVARATQITVPVRNQYLQDYHIRDELQRGIRLPLEVAFADPFGARLTIPEAPSAMLRGADGSILGYASVRAAAPEDVVAGTAARYSNVMVFWTLVLAAWLFFGLWMWHRRQLKTSTADAQVNQTALNLLPLALVGIAWWAIRYLLVELQVPARWLSPGVPGGSLFDPTYFASRIGAGVAQSAGDFLLTAFFGVVFALIVLEWCYHQGFLRGNFLHLDAAGAAMRAVKPSMARFYAVALGAGLLVTTFLIMHAGVVRHAILDSTLDYFARTGLTPDPMVLVVFCALLLFTLYLFLISIAVFWTGGWLMQRYRPNGVPASLLYAGACFAALVPVIAAYFVTNLPAYLPFVGGIAFFVTICAAAVFGVLEHRNWSSFFTLRRILLTAFIVTTLTYPLVYWAMDSQRKIRMMDAADAFADGRDVRAMFAVEQVLTDTRANPLLQRSLLASQRFAVDQDFADSLSADLVAGSFLTTLEDYEVSFNIFDAWGNRLGGYYEFAHADRPFTQIDADVAAFELLRDMYLVSGDPGVLVEPITGRREQVRLQYGGIAAVRPDPAGPPVGWITARAEPRTVLYAGETPFPRVLVPAGLYGDWRGNLSIAAFQNGNLVRSRGQDFGRYRLPPDILTGLGEQNELWRTERVGGERFLTFYYLPSAVLADVDPMPAGVRPGMVIAVRAPALMPFDHLYYLLRLTVAGLLLGIIVYLVGLVLRRRAGMLPASRVHFRDKVLDAFIAVGIISVFTMGLIGRGVIATESRLAVRSHLEQHLQQVEEVLLAEAMVDEMPYQVIERIRVDSLAFRLGLDLNLYRGSALVASSRPQLVRQRLIDTRLPLEAYEDLYINGFRHTFADELIGTFRYTTGYRALADERGLPRWVVAVPTLPEQERIEEERARTIAYLFGALLLLLLIVIATATLLGSALARPIARLRGGLQAVAEGRFERLKSTRSRDEIGELVVTFNEMQDQLVDSRKRIARQERDLAWREMARQVAHEIKNPLTPMKLSIQHLRRAHFERRRSEGNVPTPEQERFESMFDRVTTTLIEQIDSLTRIANEFSTFARLPARRLEQLDLNDVIREAASLAQEEENVEILLDLSPRPLPVLADREELRRIYFNLLKNAHQAMPEGGSISIHTERSDDGADESARKWVFSAVSDTGTGIPSDVQEKIFQPNFSTKTSGMGLGLAIVKRAIEDIDGEIGFETVEGQGTTFWIRLPLAEGD